MFRVSSSRQPHTKSLDSNQSIGSCEEEQNLASHNFSHGNLLMVLLLLL